MKFFSILMILLGIILFGCALSDDGGFNPSGNQQSQTICFEGANLPDDSSEMKEYNIDFRKR